MNVNETLFADTCQVKLEANRCLTCADAPCVQACPVNVDVPLFIQQICNDDYFGAAQTIYSNCALGCSCGYVCPGDLLCEGACTLIGMGQTPIRIGALQVFACTAGGNFGTHELQSDLAGDVRIAIIGAGPTGLGCARELLSSGLAVDLYDQAEEPGGTLIRMTSLERLPAKAMQLDWQQMANNRLRFFSKTLMDATLAKHLRAEYDFIFLGIGQTQPFPSGISGAAFPQVYSALDILRKGRQGEINAKVLGKRVIIVGGGIEALDTAILVKHLGVSQVIVIYSKSRDEMHGWEQNYLEACRIGISFQWMRMVEEVVGEDGRVMGLRVAGTRFVDNNHEVICEDPDLPFQFQPCDAVIFALGRTAELHAADLLNVPHHAGRIEVLPGTSRTLQEHIYAAGEVVSGSGTTAACLKAGKAAAREMIADLAGAHAKNQ